MSDGCLINPPYTKPGVTFAHIDLSWGYFKN